MRKTFSILFTIFFSAYYAFGQIPAGYYDDAIGKTGDELKASLHNIIDDHVEYSYNDLRDFILKNTDEDPNNSDNVILLYSGKSRAKDLFGGNVGDWNREHVWAKSHGDFGNTPPEGTDAHHIRPTDVQVNGTRSNLDFDNGGSPVSGAPGCKVDSDSFEPRDEVKGDVARMIFYMAVRYEGGSGETNLEVVDAVNTSPQPLHGKLSSLLDWHANDLPDDFEKNRNDIIYYDYQENRNPFIDHPEFVEDIWGNPAAIEDAEAAAFICYPNPVTDHVFVEYEQHSGFNYILSAMDGSQVIAGTTSTGKTEIDLSQLTSGIYILNLSNQNNSNIQHIKLIKTTR